MSTRQLDQAVFGAVLSEDVDWQPFPSFPPAARLAVVVGDPSQAAPTWSGSSPGGDARADGALGLPAAGASTSHLGDSIASR